MQLSPGDPIPAHGGTQEDDEKEAAASAGLSKEAIAGIAVGAVAGAAMLCVLVWLWTRNRDLASVLRYSRPPTSRLAPVPGSSQDAQPSPYMPPTPNYNEQKLNPMVQIQGAHSPDFNPHQSWMSGPTVRASSPDGYAQNGMMSPNAFANGFQQSPHNSYNPNLSPQPANYHLQSSPSETPWSPGGFGQVNNAGVPQEMGAGQHGMPQGNNGYVAVPTSELP